MQPFSHRVANEGWCLEINGVLWAVRARIGAGRFPYILWDHIQADQVPITWIRWYFITKSSSTQASFAWKNETNKNTEGTEIPKAESTIQFFYEIRLFSSSMSLLHEKRRKGSATCPGHSSLRGPDEVRVSKCLFFKGMQGKSPSKGSPSAWPSQSLTNRCSWQMQSTKCAHLWKGIFFSFCDSKPETFLLSCSPSFFSYKWNE